MAETDQATQGVTWEVGDKNGKCWVRFSTAGAQPLTITIDPQAAFEMGELLARAAHQARFGAPPANADASYLADQIRRRTTEDSRKFLVRRIEIMLNSLRENRTWTNVRLAQKLVETVMAKVT